MNKPLIWPALTGMAVNFFIFISNFISNFTAALSPNIGSIPWWGSGIAAAINVVCFGFFYKWLEFQAEAREKWVERRWNHWLYDTELPDPGTQEDWHEIERAWAALLKADIEPTVERCKDWLRREEHTKKRIQQYGCHHKNVEHITTDKGQARSMVCTRCGDVLDVKFL